MDECEKGQPVCFGGCSPLSGQANVRKVKKNRREICLIRVLDDLGYHDLAGFIRKNVSVVKARIMTDGSYQEYKTYVVKDVFKVFESGEDDDSIALKDKWIGVSKKLYAREIGRDEKGYSVYDVLYLDRAGRHPEDLSVWNLSYLNRGTARLGARPIKDTVR